MLSSLKTPTWFSWLLVIYLAPLILFEVLYDIHKLSFATPTGLFGTVDIVGLVVFGWFYVFPIFAAIALFVALTLDLFNRKVDGYNKRTLLFTVLIIIFVLLVSRSVLEAKLLRMKIPGFIHPMEAALVVSALIGTLFFQMRCSEGLRRES